MKSVQCNYHLSMCVSEPQAAEALWMYIMWK